MKKIDLKISLIFILIFILCSSYAVAASSTISKINDPYDAEKMVTKYNELMTIPVFKMNPVSRLGSDDKGTYYIATNSYSKDFKLMIFCGTNEYIQNAVVTVPLEFNRGDDGIDNVDKILEAFIISYTSYQPKTIQEKRRLLGTVYTLHYGTGSKVIRYSPSKFFLSTYELKLVMNQPSAQIASYTIKCIAR